MLEATNTEAKRVADIAKRIEDEKARIASTPLGTCTREDTKSCPKGQVCFYRYVNSISNPNDAGYQNALREDPDLVRGNEKFMCVYDKDADSIAALNNKKDPAT